MLLQLGRKRFGTPNPVSEMAWWHYRPGSPSSLDLTHCSTFPVGKSSSQHRDGRSCRGAAGQGGSFPANHPILCSDMESCVFGSVAGDLFCTAPRHSRRRGSQLPGVIRRMDETVGFARRPTAGRPRAIWTAADEFMGLRYPEAPLPAC